MNKEYRKGKNIMCAIPTCAITNWLMVEYKASNEMLHLVGITELELPETCKARIIAVIKIQ